MPNFAGVDAQVGQKPGHATQSTAHNAIQQAAYEYADIIFAFGDLVPLQLPDSANVVHQQTAVGAASALLGYVKSSQSKKVAVVASSGTFLQMVPQLRKASCLENVVFYIGAAQYDYASGSLVANVDEAYDAARQLGYPVYVSANSPADAVSTSEVAIAARDMLKTPVVVLYDAVRGVLTSSFGRKALPAQPYTYTGSAEPESVVVTLASSPVEVQNQLIVKIPGADIIEHIPATATTVFVDGPRLYKGVKAALRLHFGLVGGPKVAQYKFEPASTFAVALLDADRGLANQVPAPIVRAADYSSAPVAITQTFDANIDAGIVQYAFSPQEALVGTKAQALIVNKPSLLRALDLPRSLVTGGTLVICASLSEVEKLSDAQKREIANGNYKVFSLDYSLLDSEATQGRTNLFALQAIVWQLLDSNLSVDALTSRIVHSNAQEMELVASTISKLIENLREKAYKAVDTKPFGSVEQPEVTVKLESVVPTSFYAAAPVFESPATEPETLSKSEVAKRVAFSEAFGAESQLRPEVNSKTYISHVKVNQRVTPDDYDRHIFHLELDISGTGLTYAIGEALGIHAPNNEDEVQRFIEWYGADPNQVVAVPNRDAPSVLEAKTVYHALRDNLDLFGKVPKKFYEGLCKYAADPEEKLRLQKLCGPAGTAELKRREDDFENYVDVLQEFSSAHPTIAELATIVAPLKRREYSIASSQKIHPNAVHLLIVVVDWKNSKGETRYGQCSKFLSDLKPGAPVTVSVKTSVMKLPTDPKTPIIMAGLGTGLAPFKAFLEEKMWQKEQGHEIGEMFLFLGSRHQRQEYLYGELFEAYKAAGVLTYIGAAFSRDQKEKIYIQHRIKQAKTELIEAFVKQGGNFYLCGPTWPVPDVSEALYDVVATDAASRGETVAEAELIEQLKDHERYILEVY